MMSSSQESTVPTLTYLDPKSTFLLKWKSMLLSTFTPGDPHVHPGPNRSLQPRRLRRLSGFHLRGRPVEAEGRNRSGIARQYEGESRRHAHGDGAEPGAGRLAGAPYLRTVHVLSALPGFLGIDGPAGLRRATVRPEPALPLQQDQHEAAEHRVRRGVAPGPVVLPPDQPRFGIHPLLPRRHVRGERLPEGHSAAPHESADEPQYGGVLPGQGHGGGGRFRCGAAGGHRGHGDLHERHDASRVGHQLVGPSAKDAHPQLPRGRRFSHPLRGHVGQGRGAQPARPRRTGVPGPFHHDGFPHSAL